MSLNKLCNSLDGKVFTLAYEMALKDALAFSSVSMVSRKNTKVKNAVRSYIDSVLGIKERKITFMDAAIFIFKDMESKSPVSLDFDFWHIQAIINKTVKCIYIMSYGNPEMRKKFAEFHCPLESATVQALIEDLKSIEQTVLESEVKAEAERYLSKSNLQLLKQPITKISFRDTSQYKLFQEIIRFVSKQKGIYPIEYSYLV